MRNLVRLLAALALAGASGSALSAQNPLQKVTFLTNYVFLGRHAPFFVGLEKGFYLEAGFDVDIAPSTGSGFVISAIEGGKADFGIAEAAPVVQAVAKGARVQAFGVYMDESPSGLASLEPYPTPGALVGRTIAASLTDSARVVLPVVFHLKGLDPSTVSWTASDPSTYFPLLIQERADLVTASIDSDVPTFRRVAGPMGKTIHFSAFADWGYDVFGYFLVTQRERIASRPEEVRAFAAATARSVAYAVEHPEEAVRILVKHNPTLDYDLMLAHWRESIPRIETAYVKEHGYGVATAKRLERSIDLVTQAFQLERRLSPEDILASGLMSR